ncbi:F0F1 ATP synthase subunit B family protein [Alteriqipengyuania lutimaris]|uniref:ATP synthase subunit b n=1 Tax=Alteriqipengyuania lutimaris TaxID=1538146 RepID=A0A395LK13_9SPHN|nr:ATPase [Alteriqipengyuania lutimaris]MBB3035196.1 F-type H+-transporting ATPase subunit b [Alteriqipengyuania lutimaris]RDS75804.1 ATPase [Alteriqipengyuania lutimaris]
MPQIDQLAETYSSQIFWLLVFFGITFFVVGRGMVPRVMDTMDKRSKQIADDISAAQSARDQADKEEEAWRVRENENRARAQALISEAKAEAAAKSEKKMSAAQKRLDKKLEEADARIAEARDSALTEIEAVATEAAQDIVAQLAGIKVTKPAANAAVKESLAHG